METLFTSSLIALSLAHVQENILLYFCLKVLFCLSHLDLQMCVYGVRTLAFSFISLWIDQECHFLWEKELGKIVRNCSFIFIHYLT